MTLCIAAVARPSKTEFTKYSTVICFDSRIETESTGADTLFKFRKVGEQWAVLLAGKIGRASELIDIYTRHFSGKTVDQLDYMDELRKPIQEFKKSLAAEYVAGMTGLTFDDFLARGPSCLPSGLFENLANDIARIEIGCQLIMIPVSLSGSKPRFYTVDVDGSVSLHEDFCAIGTGTFLADAWLYFREQSRHNLVENTIIKLAEAKKFAESAPGVGKKTTIMVISADGIVKSVIDAEHLRDEVWRKYGPRKIAETINLKIEYFPDHAWSDTAIG